MTSGSDASKALWRSAVTALGIGLLVLELAYIPYGFIRNKAAADQPWEARRGNISAENGLRRELSTMQKLGMWLGLVPARGM